MGVDIAGRALTEMSAPNAHGALPALTRLSATDWRVAVSAWEEVTDLPVRQRLSRLERVLTIEPALSAWEGQLCLRKRTADTVRSIPV